VEAGTVVVLELRPDGRVWVDIDAAAVGNGVIALMLAVLMSVTQIGTETAVTYSQDVAAVFDAALTPPAAR
jgi:hypothetical protein